PAEDCSRCSTRQPSLAPAARGGTGPAPPGFLVAARRTRGGRSWRPDHCRASRPLEEGGVVFDRGEKAGRREVTVRHPEAFQKDGLILGIDAGVLVEGA